jgi:hypothetical protein
MDRPAVRTGVAIAAVKQSVRLPASRRRGTDTGVVMVTPDGATFVEPMVLDRGTGADHCYRVTTKHGAFVGYFTRAELSELVDLSELVETDH